MKTKIPVGWRRLKLGEKIRATDHVSQWDGGFKPFPKNMILRMPVQRGETVIRRERKTCNAK